MPAAGRLKTGPPATRPIVEAAIKTVRSIAPTADEIPYRMEQPRSKSMMWKLVRYAVGGKPVVGIGTFTSHSAIFFYQGRELDDGSGLLQGSGKDTRFVTLRAAGDAHKPAVRKLVQAAFDLARR
jgi:hypothetical protein